MKIKIIITESKDKIPGGLGSKLHGSMKQKHQEIADKHGVPLQDIEDQLEMGLKIEMEHTTDKAIAHEIAMDHLMEDPHYYTNLSKIEEEKKDACYRKVKARYDVWPSAYASGALVKCRKVGAKNWGNSKNEAVVETIKKVGDKWVVYPKKGGKRLGTHDTEESAKKQLAAIEISKHQNEEKERKLTDKPSSETSLHDWFGRKGEKGSKQGWVDCNSPDGDGGYKSCGREEGEERSKFPSCRPTPSSCKTHKSTKGKSWGKKSAKGKK
jgi:hypothetical protein